MEHLIIFPSEEHCTYIKSHPDNNSFRTITNMDHYKSNSIKTKVHPKNTGPTQATNNLPRRKLNSFRFDDPYYHSNPTENTHEDTNLIDTQEQYIKDTEVEQE